MSTKARAVTRGETGCGETRCGETGCGETGRGKNGRGKNGLREEWLVGRMAEWKTKRHLEVVLPQVDRDEVCEIRERGHERSDEIIRAQLELRDDAFGHVDRGARVGARAASKRVHPRLAPPVDVARDVGVVEIWEAARDAGPLVHTWLALHPRLLRAPVVASSLLPQLDERGDDLRGRD